MFNVKQTTLKGKYGMYVEISGRSVRKTNRLIRAANKVHAAGGKAVIICMSPGNARAVEAAGAKTPHIYSTGEYAKIAKKGAIPKGAKIFVDDFDHHLLPFPIVKDGYYATTPRLLRDKGTKADEDPLLQIVKMAGGSGKVVNHQNSEVAKQMKREQGAVRSDVIFQLQALGNYVRPAGRKAKAD